MRPAPSAAAKAPLRAYPDFLQDLLLARNIDTEAEAERFLRPQYEEMHDPFLMKNMERAVERILQAVRDGERIAWWTDYDGDGLPAAALLYDFFKKIGYTNFVNYIPHRHEEGYGLNTGGLSKLKDQGVSLVVTADCGITDTEAVDHANTLGMDLIVTDHHLPNGALPNAYAVLNIKQEGETYPFRELCGAGTAFKLVQGLIARGNFALTPGWEKWLLDMAGLATIADMVPLVGENRILAKYGLLVLRKSPRLGVVKLCRKMNVRQRFITEDDIGFMIAPRINAASRMSAPEEAFRLLVTDDEIEADTLATHLNKLNDVRKGTVAAMTKEIKKRMSERIEIQEVIVMGHPSWKPALLGLAANSLVEEYNRPVFLWGREGGGVLKGSCRSDGSVNLVTLMEYTKESFIAFGGHKYSGGFSVVHESIHSLEARLSEAYREVKDTNPEGEELVIERKLEAGEVTWELWNMLESLAPFGVGNPKPLFMFEHAKLKNVRWFGKEANHLELLLERAGKSLSATSFFAARERFSRSIEYVHVGESVSLIATIEKSTFGRAPELRLRIVDVL